MEGAEAFRGANEGKARRNRLPYTGRGISSSQSTEGAETEAEEFPGAYGGMARGNSFPSKGHKVSCTAEAMDDDGEKVVEEEEEEGRKNHRP